MGVVGLAACVVALSQFGCSYGTSHPSVDLSAALPDLSAALPDMGAAAPDLTAWWFGLCDGGVELHNAPDAGGGSVTWCDGSGHEIAPCTYPCAGRIATGLYSNVLANYDNCAMVVDNQNTLSTIDPSGNVQPLPGPVLNAVTTRNALLLWYQGDTVAGWGKLAVWRRQRGLVPLADASSSFEGFATDDLHVVFLGSVPNQPETLRVGGLDCSGKNGVSSLDSAISIRAGITGGRVVETACDQGEVHCTSQSFDPATGVATVFGDLTSYITSPPTWLSSIGTVLLTHVSDGMLSVIPASGGTRVDIGNGWPIRPGGSAFTQDGTAVLYASTGGSIVRAPADGSPATVALASGATPSGAFVVSPDGNWIVYSKTFTPMHGHALEDAWLVSTGATLPPVPLNTAGTIEAGPGAIQFTDDSRWVLWIDGGVSNGMLHARPVSTGGERILGKARWVVPAAGSRVVWDDAYPYPAYPQANIWFVDLADPNAAPRLVATELPGTAPWLDVKWSVSTDKRTVFHVQPDGVYAVPLP